MRNSNISLVTGAFSYTGKYITEQLLSMGEQIRTITGHPDRKNPFGDKVKIYPLSFNNQEKLLESMKNVDTIYNTYWIRFSYKENTFENAIENTRKLIESAKEAGVRRIVHVSIANPSEDSNLPYYKGKAILENILKESKLSYAIVRPTLIYGREDILVNNIAWCLRKFPFFILPGDGNYKVQPIFVNEYAELAIQAGHQKENIIQDAVGPDIFTFEEFVSTICDVIGSKARIIHQNPNMTFFFTKIISYMVHDVILTRDEIQGLMDNLLISHEKPLGKIRFVEWLKENKDILGSQYSSELQRHYR